MATKKSPKISVKKRQPTREALNNLTECMRQFQAEKSSHAKLQQALLTYEQTGDHNHGRGPIKPGAPCPGGDCSVSRARKMLAGKFPLDRFWRDLARKEWHKEGSIEIDEEAKVSGAVENDGRGAYVQAWVWVDLPATEE